jgi:hypothetical protein
MCGLKSDLHAAIKGNRLQGRNRARIIRKGNKRGLLRIGARIKERAISRISVVEKIVDKPKKLNMLVHLIGGVQVCDPIERQLGILVSVVADKILSADNEHIGTELELGRERVVTTELHLMTWNARDMIARRHEYISIRIGEGIVWRGQGRRKLVGCIDEGVIHIGGKIAIVKLHLGFDALPQGRGNIGEIFAPRDRACQRDDVVGAVGTEEAGLPIDLARIEDMLSAGDRPRRYVPPLAEAADRKPANFPKCKADSDWRNRVRAVSVPGSLPNSLHKA